MNKRDIARLLASQLNISQKEALAYVEMILESIIDALAEGTSIQLKGFGAFQLITQAVRRSRNPRTGEKVSVAPANQIRFKPGSGLKDAVQAPKKPAPKKRAAAKKKAAARDVPKAPRYLWVPSEKPEGMGYGARAERQRIRHERRLQREAGERQRAGTRRAAASPLEEAAPPEEAAPAGGERFLQARVESDRGRRIKHLKSERDYSLGVFIGAQRSDWLGLGEPMEEPPPRPDGRPNRLRVVFWEPEVCPKAKVKDLDLWPTGDTETCRFQFRTKPGKRGFDGRISVYFENRLLQAGRLVGGIGGGEVLRFRLDSVPLARFEDQDGRAPVGASVVLDATASGEPMMCIYCDGKAEVAPPKAVDIRVGQESTLEAFSDAIGRSITKITANPKNYAGLNKEGTRALLCDLAKRGATLLTHLKKRTHMGTTLDDAPYIQITRAHADAFFPLEFLYDGLPPEPSAKVCDGAADAKAARKALTSGICCGAYGKDPENTVCPLRFWSLSKVIERHAYVPDNANIQGQLRVGRASPSAQRPSLSPLASVVVSTSNRVDKARAGTAARLQARLKKIAGRAPFAAAANWDNLAEKIAEVHPHLIVLLPHHEYSQGDDLLELGGQARETTLLRRRHVRADGDDDLAPVVLLIGCETNEARINLESCVMAYQDQGAAIIVSTIASILGRDAGPAAETIVEQLSLIDGSDATFGSAMLAARRKLMVDGLPMVLGLTSYGDADWLIRR